MRAAYDELVDELLEERSEALRIAQAYKAELERVQISDDDIQSLDAVTVDTAYFNQVVAMRPALAENRHVAPRRIDGDVTGRRGAAACHSFGRQSRIGIKYFLCRVVVIVQRKL